MRLVSKIVTAALALVLLGAPCPAGDEKPPSDADPVLTAEQAKEHEARVKVLVKRLRKERNKERVRADIQLMGAGGRAERDALIEFSRGHKNHDFLTEAFKSIGSIGGKTAIEYLTGKYALRSFSNFLVQIAAAETLGELGDARGVDAMLAVLADRKAKIEVQGAICQALSKCAPDDERVVEAIFDKSRHKKDTIRANAIEALGRLRSDAAFDRLVHLLVRDKNTRCRGAAATALGHSGRKEAVPHLQRAAREDGAFTVKDCAARALKELGAALTE
jgi:hypothetical protein